MLSSLQRLFLVGCLCVQFPRQFCSIPERLIPSFPSLSLSSLISKRRCCLLLWPSLPRALSSVHLSEFLMCRSRFRVSFSPLPWFCFRVPTLMSFWAWIGLCSTRPILIVQPDQSS